MTRPGFALRLCWISIIALHGEATAAHAQATPDTTAQAEARIESEPETFLLRGEVRDYLSEEPIEGAVVQVSTMGLIQTTDRNGYFEFRGVEAGEHVFVTAGFGYETNRESSAVAPNNIMLVRLNPMAIAIEGITVEVEAILAQLETRRLMTGIAVETFDEPVLRNSITVDLTGYVREHTADFRLFKDINDHICVQPRGSASPVRLVVYLDESRVPAIFLDNLTPQDIASLEVYKNIAQVRVYTHNFLERAAEVGYQPMPIHLQEQQLPCGR